MSRPLYPLFVNSSHPILDLSMQYIKNGQIASKTDQEKKEYVAGIQ